MKRTPGPWKYGRTLTHGLAVFSNVTVGSPEHIVAIAEDNVDNARLISASPDMLESLQEIWGMIERGELVRDISGDMGNDFALKMLEYVPRLNRMRMAIVKATGADEL